MRRIWKKAPSRDETLAGAVARLKHVEGTVVKSQANLMAKIKHADTQAKSYILHYPQMARACLRQKQSLLEQHAQVTRQLATIQQQLTSLEMNMVTTEVVRGVQATHAALAATQAPNAPDRVADLLDATQEKMDEALEVAEVVGGAAAPVDEDLPDREMAMLFESQMPSYTRIEPSPMPKKTIPETVPPQQQDAAEEMAQWAEL